MKRVWRDVSVDPTGRRAIGASAQLDEILTASTAYLFLARPVTGLIHVIRQA